MTVIMTPTTSVATTIIKMRTETKAKPDWRVGRLEMNRIWAFLSSRGAMDGLSDRTRPPNSLSTECLRRCPAITSGFECSASLHDGGYPGQPAACGAHTQLFS